MLLNYKVKLSSKASSEPVYYYRPYFSKNGRVFTCVIDDKYGIKTGDFLFVNIEAYSTMQMTPTVESFVEQGYVKIPKVFKVYEVEREGKTYKTYYFFNELGLLEVVEPLGSNEGLLDATNKTYTKKVEYFIEDGKLLFEGIEYDVLFDEDGVAKIQAFDGLGNLIVYGGEKEKWRRRQRLTFTCSVDSILPIDSIQGGYSEPYIEIDGKEYILQKEWSQIGEDSPVNIIKRYLILDGEKIYEDELSGPTRNEKDEVVNDVIPYTDVFSGVITIKGIPYTINERYVNGEQCECLLIYLNNENMEKPLQTSTLVAERVLSYVDSYRTGNDTSKLEIDGVSYPTEVVDMITFDTDREIEQDDDNTLYFITLDDNTRVYFDKENSVFVPTKAITSGDTTEYPISKKQKVVVDNVTYYRDLYEIDSENDDVIKIEIEEDYYTPCVMVTRLYGEGENATGVTSAIENGFLIRRKPSYNLNIIKFVEPNLCVCCVDLGDVVPSTDLNPLFFAIHNDIVKNQNKFVIKSEPARFAVNKNNIIQVDKLLTDISNAAELASNHKITEPMANIAITQRRNNLSVPLQLTAIHGTNLQQEDLIKDKFVDKYVKEAINPIVDMEKDIYYPMKDVDGKGSLIDVTDVEFYIHLRTRDADWNVNEDYYTNFNENYTLDTSDSTSSTDNLTENTDDSTSNTNSEPKTSWNIFDYYPSSAITSYEYYQPSDLLGFFDFNDIDIFYQKSKVGKSFLRLMLFDTDDPRTQSLLGTATIFLDSSTLFGKFSDKTNNPSNGIMYENPQDGSKSNYINVASEPYPYKDTTNDAYTFNEEDRISSKISVSDKLSSTKSAEGFYFYIFREYSYFLHERTIYLRAQFNHAGRGTVIDLIQPTETVYYDDGTKSEELMQFNNETKIKDFKKGVETKELYKMMFIPINVKYDIVSNKYCWYLPTDLVKHEENKIKFNLYEIKTQSL